MWGLNTATRLARLRHDDSGATAVEFAIVAGPFFFLIGCIVETGLMLFTEYVLQSSVQEAARLVRTGQAQEGSRDAGWFKNAVCDTAGVIINCSGDVSVYLRADATFAALQSALPSYLSVGASYGGSATSSSYDCGAAGEAVALVATYDWDFAFPFMNFLGNFRGGEVRRIYGLAIFRNEPFGS